MKTKVVKTVFTLCALAFASQAHAGREGNGGGAYICSVDPSKSVFLDLYEAQLDKAKGGLGLQVPPSNDPVETQVQNAFQRLNSQSALYAKMEVVYAEVQNAKPVPTGDDISIAWPSDERNKYSPTNCTSSSGVTGAFIPRGVILFNDDDNSKDIDVDTFNSLPPTQQAAALVHETVYKFLRETQNDQDSRRARKIVGHLFATESQNDLDDALFEIARLAPDADSSLHLLQDDIYHYQVSYVGEPVTFTLGGETDPANDGDCETPQKAAAVSGSFEVGAYLDRIVYVQIQTTAPWGQEVSFVTNANMPLTDSIPYRNSTRFAVSYYSDNAELNGIANQSLMGNDGASGAVDRVFKELFEPKSALFRKKTCKINAYIKDAVGNRFPLDQNRHAISLDATRINLRNDHLDNNGVLRRSDNKPEQMPFNVALSACPSGTHLPTARELAQLSQTAGAIGILELNQVDPTHIPSGYIRVTVSNSDGKKDDFYFNGNAKGNESSWVKTGWYWSSSKWAGAAGDIDSYNSFCSLGVYEGGTSEVALPVRCLPGSSI